MTKKVYLLTSSFPDHEKYGLTSQLRRSMVSISSNIAEGSARFSRKDQAKFYQYAYSSLMEASSQLHLAVELDYLEKEKLSDLEEELLLLSNKLNKFYKSTISRIEEPEEFYSKSKALNKSTNQQISDELIESTPQQFNNSTIQQYSNTTITKKSYFFHYTANIDDGVNIGDGTKVWHYSHIMTGCRIGNNCSLGQNVFVASKVTLGNNVKVQNNVSIYEGVTCDDDVFLGPNMVFTNVINPRAAVNRKNEYKETWIKKGASIGANATIVCGNNVGEYAFVGAGAVVNKSIKPYALVIGNPARQIGWMSRAGYRLEFDIKGKAVCENTKEEYLLENSTVSLYQIPNTKYHR